MMKTAIKILILTLIMPYLMTGCGKDEHQKTVTPVRVEKVTIQSENASIRYTATVNPYSQVNLDFKVDGYVLEILQVEGADGRMRDIQEGDNVTKGLPLALVDPTEYLAKVVEAKSQLTEARATQQKDTEAYNRAQILYAEKSMIAPEYDRAVKNYKVSNAQVKAAEANLIEADQNLSYCTLRPPSNGVLLKRNIEVGTLVRPGSEGFVLADVTSVKVLFSVPDIVLGDVRLGQVMEVTTESVKDTLFLGRITEIAPAANTRSRVFNVEITIQNPENLLKPGMIASLNVFKGDTADAVFLLPLASIVRSVNSQDGYAVFTVEESDGKTRTFRKDVKLGSVYGNKIAIIEGLHEGEQVITIGAQQVRSGEEVSIIY
ncbi:MAG: efflux RND transporter periplasmic adaptor subunit [Candidatus Dadabacteria bacterium]|nr:MAG: efflux RND transporter periplasmic adaptor subunit [Candidatus Dadabacteria bacterium]TDI99566.1 MAG: efflux RND transporter periplasmic adaptor subunit [Candidatus Dadabacteria bacterium]